VAPDQSSPCASTSAVLSSVSSSAWARQRGFGWDELHGGLALIQARRGAAAHGVGGVLEGLVAEAAHGVDEALAGLALRR
jgi:hypothetical protein